ncbi:tetratricopeptide repeat protein [Chryseobacterium sp. L7]|uniref:Tetratricopeptide repeat protein n=1 Tax=Chryseobacterium endalhagicum TaxID=2797638 RepID=A0ABS1QD17_9FLAO|nr:tetratricopeptide repeat protein [Chryseobacterium endalhagicum]MBL1220196.1 tetratricopeptide repeat protein [Chryseobacterium endalhagicum]
MQKIIPYLLFFMFFITSCKPEEEDDYFLAISKELTIEVRNDPEKMKEIFTRELDKYQETGDMKFLISSKQVEVVIYGNDKQKQIPLCYDLLKLNNGRYPFITINCNNNLSAYFEKSSPEWALKYVNDAIRVSEKTEKKYSLEHLYHFKGRILYNEGKYEEAILLFEKALEIFSSQHEIMYIASMHNNFGLCYEKMNQPKRAIEETEKAIKILSGKPDLRNVEKIFLNYMKGGLADYYRKAGDYQKAEALLRSELDFSLRNKNYGMAINASGILMGIYDSILINPLGTDHIVKSLVKVEPELKDNENKITLNTILQNYYLKTNDIQSLMSISKKLTHLNRENNENSRKEIETKLKFANQYLIKSANQEFEYEKKKNIFFLMSIFLLIAVFLLIIFLLIRMKKRKFEVHAKEKELFIKENEILTKEKIIFEKQRKILEKDVQIQKEKINHLHLNLNLKTETEREFLENIKKIKKSKSIDTEEVLRNLQLKMNNLILIDKKNNDLIDESSEENKKFIENLSGKYPSLTEQELQLCVYFKLDLTAKEVSLLEKFTVGSIRVYKTKIKVKMGLGREDSLSAALSAI